MSGITKDYFAHARVGLFTHYTYATYAEGKGTNWGGTHYSQTDPRGAVSAEEAAALFDGEKFTEAWYGNTRLSLTAEGDGYVIGMPAERDEIDTVIRLIAG